MAVVNLRLHPKTFRVRSRETRFGWNVDPGKTENEVDRMQLEARQADQASAFGPDDREDIGPDVEADLHSMGGIES